MTNVVTEPCFSMNWPRFGSYILLQVEENREIPKCCHWLIVEK